ncbi:MAG: hypothetical protein JXB13_02055 [Phycisphaerae bacterium]|nr:hypothetical protein [Phycisphaerae bacterium]
MEAFAQRRTGDRAHRLGLSQLACVGRHTVTGLLSTSGRQFVDWSADYRLFSRDQWDTAELFVPIVRGILDLSPHDRPFVGAMDDTFLRKTGTKIPGVGYGRDPMSPPFQVNLIRGQRFLQLSGILPPPDRSGPARAVPIRFEHVPPVRKPPKNASEQDQRAYRQRKRTENLSARGVQVLHQVRRELDERHAARARRFIVGVDGSYTNQTVLKQLPERTVVIGRIRKDAGLFHPPRPEEQLPVGTKRKYGRPAPTPDALRQDALVPWQEVTAYASGKLHAFRVKTLAPVLWKKAGFALPLRLVVVAPVGYRLRKASKLLYRQPAFLICTDPDLPLDQLLQDYLWRWQIEVNHRDEKQIIGVGEAQVRSPESVGRQPAFAVASYATLLLAAAQESLTGATVTTLASPKWQAGQHRLRLSTQELIRQLRSEVWDYAIKTLCGHSDHFATATLSVTKCPESQLPAVSALLYGATG